MSLHFSQCDIDDCFSIVIKKKAGVVHLARSLSCDFGTKMESRNQTDLNREHFVLNLNENFMDFSFTDFSCPS